MFGLLKGEMNFAVDEGGALEKASPLYCQLKESLQLSFQGFFRQGAD